MWTGHEMFNVKDIPVATGYTLVTLGLVLCVREEHSTWRYRLARAGCLVAGLVLAIGTRPGIWSGLFAGFVVAIAGVVVAVRTKNMTPRVAVGALIDVVAACAVAAAALVAIYPHLFGSPLAALPRTTESSSSFVDGVAPDRFYVPRHVLEEIPTILLVFALTGIAVGGLLLWKRWRTSPVEATRVTLVGVQVLALPVMAIVVGSDLYHGLRQLLFAAPAAAVLTAYGMAWWMEHGKPRRRWVELAAAAALILPVIDQATLFPYQTTYVNFATDAITAPFASEAERPGTDYWRVSIPEVIEDQPLDRLLLCKATVDVDTNIAYPFTNAGELFSTSRNIDCRQEENGPLFPEQLPVVRAGTDGTYDAVFLKTLPNNCTSLNEVTRMRHGFEVVLTILGRCTVLPAPLDEQGVQADDPALGTAGPGDLWRYAIDGWQQWPGEAELTSPVQRAQLVFEPTAPCRSAGCTLVIDGDAPDDLVVKVNSESVPVTHATDGTLQIPISASQMAGDSGVWVTLSRPSGAILEIRMTGLSLVEPMEGQE